MKFLVSIILPVYNGERFLAEAIESCLNQTYQNFELIIVNDCSTDNSLQIAKQYCAKDSRIKIISNDINKNLPASLNIGHNHASGDFLTWTSDDNILKENMLELLMDYIIQTDCDLVFSNYDVIEEDGKYRRTHSFGPVCSLPFGSCIGASFLYKKELFVNLDGYDERLHTLEDYDFWLRAAMRYRFQHLEKSLYKYRVHPNNLTSNIYNDSGLNKLFKEKHMMVYEKLSIKLNWSDSTTKFISMVRGFEKWDWEFYKKDFNQIVADLKKFQKLINANDKRNILQMMDSMLRHKILKEPANKSLYIKLFFKRPGIFFDPYYSKRTSLKILKKLI